VAIIRLRVERSHSAQLPSGYFDEKGRVRELLWLRLRTTVLIGRDPAFYPPNVVANYDSSRDSRLSLRAAIIDTGAYTALFPMNVWTRFDREITWLNLACYESDGTIKSVETATGTVGGGHYEYRLGRVWLGAVDLWRRRLPAVPLIARFRQDDPEDSTVLIGMGGGFFENRRLTREPTSEAEDPDPPPDPSPAAWAEVRRTYGQRWWVSDW
jgi:hypothetical protein